MSVRPQASSSWLQFAAWAISGAALAMGLLAAFTFGPFALLAAPLFAGVAVLLGGANVSAVGAGVGPGVLSIGVAWLNRDGPGSVCSADVAGQVCTQEWAPWPWFAAGVVLIAIPVTVFVHARHHDQWRGVVVDGAK